MLLQAANMEEKVLKQIAIREKKLIGNFKTSEPRKQISKRLRTHQYSDSILKKYSNITHKAAVETTGDGSCLFNATSIALCGDESLATTLKVLCGIEMVNNQSIYINHSLARGFELVSPDYWDSCRDCFKNGGFSSAWTILALSQVIERRIISVYPACNGPDDMTKEILSCSISARSFSYDDPIYIMWTRMGPTSQKCWTPNHFVPLVNNESVDNRNQDDICYTISESDSSESTAGYFKSTLSPIRGNNQQVIIDDGDQCSFSFPTTSYHNKVTSTPEKYKRTDISNIKKKEPNYAQMHMEEDEIENIFPEKMKMENDKKLPLRKRKPKRESELIASKRSFQENVFADEAILTSDLDESDVIEFTTSIKKAKLHYQTVVEAKKPENAIFSYIDDKIPKLNRPTKIPSLAQESKEIATALTSFASSSDFVDDIEIQLDKLLKEAKKSKTSLSRSSDFVDDIDIKQDELLNFIKPKKSSNNPQNDEYPPNDSMTSEPYDDETYMKHDLKQNSLPFGEFLTTNQVIVLLLKSGKSILDTIPKGKKENVYYVVDNSNNYERGKQKICKRFYDDCGAWTCNTTSSTVYLETDKEVYKEIHLIDGLYCKRKTREKCYLPLDPQPDAKKIVVVSKYYSKLKVDTQYRRKITWIKSFSSEFEKRAFVEYTGKFPHHSPHGNSKHNRNVYIRTSEKTMESVKDKVLFATGRKLYDALQTDNNNLLDKPRDLRLIYNAKSNQAKKKLNDLHTKQRLTYGKTYGDEILQVINMAQTHEFVQRVNHGKNCPTSIILYVAQQILDIKRFCCSGSTVLGIDKTFNLGKVYATVMVFKNLSVVKSSTGEHPLFLGPILLHCNSNYETFSFFFIHLRAVLGDHKKLIFGTDDEQALHKAALSTFPSSKHALCTSHLKTNLTQYLINKVGLEKKARKLLSEKIFSVLDATDEVSFDLLCRKIVKECDIEFSGLASYLNSRFFPLLKDKVWKVSSLVGTEWTNNNSESMNHVLKCKTEWKLKKLPDLITIIFELVTSMYVDVNKAVASIGPYELSPAYKQFVSSFDEFKAKTVSEQAKHIENFMTFKPVTSRLTNYQSISTNSNLITRRPAKSAGKKIGQRRRSAANRAPSNAG